jgi:capsular polysaccharide biosynthesis protein
MQPIDQNSQHLLALHEGRIPWGLTFPLPTLLPAQRIQGFVAAIPAVKNYYHTMVDYLFPVMAAIIRNPSIFNKPITLVINKPSAATSFIMQLLCEAGFDARIKQINPFESVSAEHYLFAKNSAASTEHGYAFYPEIKSLDAFISAHTKNIDVPESIVINRTQTSLRNVLNQAEMLKVFDYKKFKPVTFNWSNILFQIACFRKATRIVSIHGATLTNLCWGENKKVLEIFPYNARKTTYLHIASQNGWSYQAHFGSGEQSNQNFSVNLNQIEAALHDL